ncbi:MAG: DNA-3-methyladenine glycosylase I [Dehalococcoidia bacterium]|nr:DNA-3-methyladenine glycosylase I [Dehalococcoidia bacterium]
MDDRVRCEWAEGGGALERAYHDLKWGVPLHDDRALFELLTLEGAQAGLSWATILKHRETYRAAFEGFDIPRIAAYGDAEVARLLADPGIIRNRAKVHATIANARATIELQRKAGSLDAYFWGFVGGTPRRNAFTSILEIPAQTEESRALSKDLKRRGFSFVGPTIMYAFMQASGLVNDHTSRCFRSSGV